MAIEAYPESDKRKENMPSEKILTEFSTMNASCTLVTSWSSPEWLAKSRMIESEDKWTDNSVTSWSAIFVNGVICSKPYL